jgi:four helix bundle protein
VQDYRKLRVWQKAHQLVVEIYGQVHLYKAPEAWPLRDQTLRAAISVPANMAEGSGRGTNPDFRRFLFHSLGSCSELEYHLLLARDIKILTVASHDRLASQTREIRRMLTGLIESIET